jgi:DNA-binding beta-propeller fold protein YncE
MRQTLRIFAMAAIGVLCVALVAALVLLVVLVFPATPRPAEGLHFAGFISLPKQRGVLSILDYLTVDGPTLYVTSVTSGDVYEVPVGGVALPGPGMVKVVPGAGEAHGVAVDPASGLAFVTRSKANHVDVFDPSSRRTVKSITIAEDADGAIFDPSHKLVYAVNGDPGIATLIDPGSQTSVGTIALGGKPEFAAFDPQTNLIYQNLEDSDAVAAVDVGKRAVVGRWSLEPCAAPTGVALDTAHRRLFAVCSKNALLVVMDLGSHRVVASLPIGGGPDSVAYDPALGRIYATGKSGVLSVVQQDGPDAYRTLDTVKLHYGAHTLAIDPSTHRVYAAYASLFTPPRLAVFDAVR